MAIVDFTLSTGPARPSDNQHTFERELNAAALLPDGRLVVMLINNKTLFINPATGTVEIVDIPLTIPPSPLGLPDGRLAGVAAGSARIVDMPPGTSVISTGMNIPSPNVHSSYMDPCAFLMSDGRVFFLAQAEYSTRSSGVVFDPKTDSFGALMSYAAWPVNLTMLVGDIVIGFPYTRSHGIYIIDPNRPNLGVRNFNGLIGIATVTGAAPLPDGKALLFSKSSSELIVFDPADNTFSRIPHGLGNNAFSGGTPLSDGRVLLFSGASSTVAVFDPADNALAVVQGPASGGFKSGVLLRDGRVFLSPTGDSGGYSYFTVNYMPKFEGGSLSLDRDLGACADSFVHPDIPAYTLEDTGAPVEATTVEERLAGVLLREFTAEEGAAVTPARMPPALYRELPNGRHNYEITAANPRGVARITHSFEKRVVAAEVRTKPLRANGRPKRAWLYVLGSFPEGCRLSVWICNNGNDEEPSWQDVTDRASVNLTEEDKTITFANEEKTADGWGVRVRVRLERGDAEGECYVSHIGGNFQ